MQGLEGEPWPGVEAAVLSGLSPQLSSDGFAYLTGCLSAEPRWKAA